MKHKRFSAIILIFLIMFNVLVGATLAAGVGEDDRKQSDSRPDYIESKDSPLVKKDLSLKTSLSQSQGGGETVIVTTGDDLDQYLYYPNTIEFDIPINTETSEITSGELTLSVYDVDEYCGTSCGGVCEVDEVYFNDDYLGTLTGADDEWSTTTFFLNPVWVNGSSGGSPGINHVKIVIDTLSKECWAVEADWGQLIIDKGAKGNAQIVALSTDKQAYSPGNTIDTTIQLTTNVQSQPVKLETNLYDPMGVNIEGGSSTYTLQKDIISTVIKYLAIPSGSSTGKYTVEAIVYDSANIQQVKKTATVTVGTDPDFSISPSDISFSQVDAVSGGYEVQVDASVHYENDNTQRNVDVNFYDEDLKTGGKTLVESKTVLMTQGTNTISIVWNPSSNNHRLTVVLDPNDKIEESNEINNQASKELTAPRITAVNSKYKGFFLSGISVGNTYYVLTSGNVDHVEFDMNGDVQTDSVESDGWSMDYGMGDLNSLGSNKLTITAYDSLGIPSNSYVVNPVIINTPLWLTSMMAIGGPLIPFSLTTLAHDNILTYKYELALPKEPKEFSVTLPSWMGPLAGKYGFGPIQFLFGFEGKSTGNINGYGGGSVPITVSDKEGKIIGKLFFTPSVVNNEIKITNAKIEILGKIEIPIPGLTYKWFGFDFTVQIVPEVTGSLNFRASEQGGSIIDGLAWDYGGVKAGSAVEGYVRSEAFGVGAEGKLGAKPRLSVNVATQNALLAFDQFGATIYVVVKAIYWWGKSTVIDLSYTWSYPPTTASSLSLKSLMASVASKEGKWEPIPRDYATADYAKFAGKKSGLYAMSLNAQSINSLGAQEGAIVQNIFPYASPAIAIDSNGNGLMLWTHDDINKPQTRGFEIYYSLWDGNTMSWSSPNAITDNFLPEFKPDVVFDTNDNAIAVWTIFNNASIDANTSALSVLNDVEIAYSVRNSTTSTWSTPILLMNNSMWDNVPRLSSVNGNVALIWVVDKDSDITTISDRDMMFTAWNGTSWGQVETVAENVSIINEPSLTYSGNNAVSVWDQDMDGNSTSTSDRELYYAEWNISSGWGMSNRLTNDFFEDSSPIVKYNLNGNPTLVWVKTNETVNQSIGQVYLSIFNASLWSSPELVAESPMFNEMKMSFDSQNNAILVWQSGSGLGIDIFYTVRDNSSQLWSGSKQLTNDTSADWQLTMAIDTDTANTLMISYIKQNITLDENGTLMEGLSDLYYLTHPIMLDLTLSSEDIVFSNSSALPGDSIEINATIHNTGDLLAEQVEVNFTDGLNGSQIGAIQSISSLPAGENTTVSVQWNIPLVQQAHDIYVEVDPNYTLPETNEENNIAFNSIILPELYLNNTVATQIEQSGIRINTTVYNSGVIPGVDVRIDFYDGNYSNETLINTTNISSIPTNANETISIYWDTSFVTSGYHDVYVIVDPLNNLTEQSESNNNATVTVEILPDLTLNSNNISFSKTSEGDITIEAGISNLGISSADNVTMEYYDGDPSMNGTLISNKTIDSISAGSEVISSITWYATTGVHEIYVFLDSNNSIIEKDETNNIAMALVTIAPSPDLSLSDIYAYNSTKGTLSMGITIQNNGQSDVLYSTIEFYNTTPINVTYGNPYVTYNPNLLGEIVIQNLSAGKSQTLDFSTNVTLNMNENYNLFSMADPNNVIHETNESNNVANNTYLKLLFSSINISKWNSSVVVNLSGKIAITVSAGNNISNGAVTVLESANPGTLSVQAINSTTSSGKAGEAISYFEIMAYDLDNMSWALIEKYYDQTTLENIDEQSLSLYWYNESGGNWIKLTNNLNLTSDGGPYIYGTGVNTADNFVWANVTHFSNYGTGVQYKSDLTLNSSDITFSNPNPTEGDSITITATVRNTNETDANNFKVEFLVDGISKANNTLSVENNSENTTQFTWTAVQGTHDLNIVADIDNEIDELDETNNNATKEITVEAKPSDSGTSGGGGGGGGGGGSISPITEGVSTLTSDLMKDIIKDLSLEYKFYYDAPDTLAGVLITTGKYPAVAPEVATILQRPISPLSGDVYEITTTKITEKYMFANTLIIARGDIPVDSMTAVGYAAAKRVPILLTRSKEIPEPVFNAIKDLNPKEIIIVGGPVAIGRGVEDELSEIAEVERIWGATRYETAVEMAKTIATYDKYFKTIVIADGSDPSTDAAIIAGGYRVPLLYIRGDEIPQDVRTFLQDHKKEYFGRQMKILTVGVSEEVGAEIEKLMATE